MKGLIVALGLALAAAPTIASAQGYGGAPAGDAQAESTSMSPTTWGLISAGVVGTVAGLAVALNSGGGNRGSSPTTTTTTTTTTTR